MSAQTTTTVPDGTPCCAPTCCGAAADADDATTLDATTLDAEQLRAVVRERYAQSARQAASSCCGPSGTAAAVDPASSALYDDEAHEVSPGALAASLGCGNPTLLADLRPGQRVLDLGSGAGLDVLLSARRVGPDGFAYGLDMTPEMLQLARQHQAEAGVTNVEFLQGTIEEVPLPDASVDVVVSNCVINLAADKDVVLAEAHRVLAPGGLFAVSDVVLLRPLPEAAATAMRLWTGCIAGALLDTEYVAKLERAGFVDASVEITSRLSLPEVPDGTVANAFVRATRGPSASV